MLEIRSICVIALTAVTTGLFAGDWSTLSQHPLVSLEQSTSSAQPMLCQLDTNRPDHDFRFDTPNRPSGWWSGREFSGLMVNGFVITTPSPITGLMIKYKMNDTELQRAGCFQPPSLATNDKIEVKLTGDIQFIGENRLDTSNLHCEWKTIQP